MWISYTGYSKNTRIFILAKKSLPGDEVVLVASDSIELMSLRFTLFRSDWFLPTSLDVDTFWRLPLVRDPGVITRFGVDAVLRSLPSDGLPGQDDATGLTLTSSFSIQANNYFIENIQIQINTISKILISVTICKVTALSCAWSCLAICHVRHRAYS